MLDQVRFSFHINLLSPTHAGDGGAEMLAGFHREGVTGDGAAIMVQTVQRDNESMPAIEASSLRGAIKAHLRDCAEADAAELLFGSDEITGTPGGEGMVRLHAGFLANRDELVAQTLYWPYWQAPDPALPRSATFVQIGNRHHADAGAVQKKFLYSLEMLPDTARFRFTGTFLGTGPSFDALAVPMFERLAQAKGFAIGGAQGYGTGRARLHGCVDVSRRSYDAIGKRFAIANRSIPVSASSSGAAATQYALTLRCEGPFLHQDPTKSAWALNDEKPDYAALLKDAASPVFSGKALLQHLRRRSVWIELCNAICRAGYDYSSDGLPGNDLDRQLREDESERDLEITQRLFGVAGWGKRVRIVAVEVDWPDRHMHRSQGISLDAMTQGPIDGAQLEIAVPAGIDVSVVLELVGDGLLNGDHKHFENVLADIKRPHRRPRVGHAAGTGFGAFVVAQDKR
jgi:hypothetical protein